MKSKIAFFTAVLALGTAQFAAAQDHPDVAYQKSLLARPLPAAEKVFCEGIVGTANPAAMEDCHVTRLFLADFKEGRSGGKFPPKVRPKYAKDTTEKNIIINGV